MCFYLIVGDTISISFLYKCTKHIKNELIQSLSLNYIPKSFYSKKKQNWLFFYV